MGTRTHKTDCRLYMTEEYKEHLKQLAAGEGKSLNGLIMELVEKKYPLQKRKTRTTVPNRKEEPEQTPAQMEERLAEVNQILERANKSGEKLPPVDFFALKLEQAQLYEKLSHK